MPKPVSGAIAYDPIADRPTAQLKSGVKRLLTQDDIVSPAGASIARNFWDPPATPHPEDVEFDSSTLPATWKLWNTSNSTDQTANIKTGINTTIGPATGTCRIEANKTRRRSWLLLQPSIAGGTGEPVWFYGYKSSFTNFKDVFRARFKTQVPVTGVANNCGNISMAIYGDTAGVPNNTRLDLGWDADPSSMFCVFRQGVNVSVSTTNIGVTLDNDQLLAGDTEFVILVDSLATSKGFINSSGLTIDMGAGTLSMPSPFWIGFLFFTRNTVAGAIPPILSVDYYRRQADNEFWGG